MKLRRIIALGCVIALLATCLFGCDSTTQAKKNSFNSEIESTDITDTFIAENQNYTLSINRTTKGVTLTDKKNGEVFGTNPSGGEEIQYDELGMPIKRHPQIESVLIIEYLNVEENITSKALSYTAVVSDGRTVLEKVKNGIKISYYFDEAQIMVPVTFTLRENGVALSIDPKEIEEDKNMLISVSVAPYWCSVKNTDNGGYLLYPSGSGALIYAKEISQPGESYSSEVYGADIAKEMTDKISTEKSIRLPVYGATNGKKASFAIIESGAESALLDTTVGSTSIGYSAVYATYQLRGYTNNLKELYNNRFYEGLVYSDNMIDTPLTIGFYPLTGEGVGYAEMAQSYREYLNKINGKAECSNNSKLDVTFVGGAMISKSFLGIPYKTLYPTTTLAQAKDILSDLKKNGVDVSNINLYGFGENGIDSNELAGGFVIDSGLGDEDDLKTLTEAAGKTNIYFDFDTVTFTDSADGFDSYFDSATRANRKPVKLYNYSISVLGKETDGAYSVLSRDRILSAVKMLNEETEEWSMDGIGLSALSSIAYSDYTDKSNSEYYAKAGMANQVSKAIKTVKNRKVLTSDANAFAALQSDLVINAPTISSKAKLFDAEIPFYSMALRGRVALSAESINLAVDSKSQLLRAVEGGMGISYTVSNSYSTKLLESKSTVFYNSLYKDIKDDIISDYKLVSDYYEKISNAFIVDHRILDSSLRETVFSNGVSVFVNYSDEEIVSSAGNVPANSFLVWEADV
ncbi:MAG: hypothetical protein E7562_04225 [Ruminococcaceae bacterium]|nr:hypothetical protein [Oscillospiraceae bacterium]